jgi:hypothetical protein
MKSNNLKRCNFYDTANQIKTVHVRPVQNKTFKIITDQSTAV